MDAYLLRILRFSRYTYRILVVSSGNVTVSARLALTAATAHLWNPSTNDVPLDSLADDLLGPLSDLAIVSK